MSAIGTRLLKLEIDGNEVTAEVSVAKIATAASEADFVTFADAAAGGARDYRLVLTAVQDAAVGSVWDLVWSASGSTVPCVLMPYGNVAPSPAQPHFGFNAVVSEPDGDLLGTDADPSPSARAAVELEWPLTGKPVKITA